MSIPKISGQQARELLDRTTPGPWELLTQDGDPDGIVEAIGPMGAEFPVGTSFYDGPILTGSTEDHRLLAAAPDLAETVAWLYGREADHVGNDQSTARRCPMVVEVDWARQVHLWPINGTPFDLHITADEAVDLARALLAAAEEARP